VESLGRTGHLKPRLFSVFCLLSLVVCVCVCVSGVLFSVGVCMYDLLLFLCKPSTRRQLFALSRKQRRCHAATRPSFTIFAFFVFGLTQVRLQQRLFSIFCVGLRLNANCSLCHANKGDAMLRLGRPLEAETEQRAQIGLLPKDSDAHFALGVALRAQARIIYS